MHTLRVIFNKVGLFLLSMSTIFFVPWFFASILLSALSTRPPIIDLKYLIIFFGAHPIWHNFQTAMNNQHRTFFVACFAAVIISLIFVSSAKSVHDWSYRKITASLLFTSLLAYGFDGLPSMGAAGWDSSIPTLFTRMLLYIFIGMIFFVSTKYIFNYFDYRRPISEESAADVHGSFWVIGGLALILNAMGIMKFYIEPSVWFTGPFVLDFLGGTLGCILLLLRQSASIYFFIASLLGVIISRVYVVNISMEVGLSLLETLILTLIPLLSPVFLIWYSRQALRKGWIC